MVAVKSLFRDLKPGEFKVLRGKRIVLGHPLFVVGSVAPDGDYLIVVTDQAPQSAIEDYLLRWGIETMFGCLKNRGFRFESTHLTIAERVEDENTHDLVRALAIELAQGYYYEAPTPLQDVGQSPFFAISSSRRLGRTGTDNGRI